MQMRHTVLKFSNKRCSVKGALNVFAKSFDPSQSARALNVFAKSFDLCQPAQSAQADMG